MTLSAKAHALRKHRLLRQPRTWDSREGYKPILRDISLNVYPGELVAIIGPSGSGKTSLINILAHRIITQTYCGDIRFLGRPLGPWIKPYLGYVQQEDTLYPTDTAREALQFTADLKLRGDRIMKKGIVDSVLRTVRLEHVADQPMGAAAGQGFSASTVKTGLSGGERRRVSIANEIVGSPRLLLLDECTSGLDISTATAVIGTLRSIADSRYSKSASTFLEPNPSRRPEDRCNNVAVVATLHQPSSYMWGLFDKVVVMAKGRVMFYGRTEHFDKVITLIGYQMPANYNPADYLIELVSPDSGQFPHCHEDRLELLSAISETFDVDKDVKEKALVQAILEGGEENPLMGADTADTTEEEKEMLSEAGPIPAITGVTPRLNCSMEKSILKTFEIDGSELMTVGTSMPNPSLSKSIITPSSQRPYSFAAPSVSLNVDGSGPESYFQRVVQRSRLDAYMERRQMGGINPLYFLHDEVYEALNYRTKYARPYMVQFYYLLARFIRVSTREPSRFVSFVFEFAFFALFAGSLFWRLGYTQAELSNRVGALFFIQTSLAFAPSSESGLRLFHTRQLYHREHASGLYGTLPFYVAMILVDLPVYLFFVIIYGAIVYFMIGFNTQSAGRWFYFIGLCFMTLLATVSFSHVWVAMFANYRVAQVLTMVIVSVIIVFAGPYINASTIPVYYIWFPWVSYFAYAFKGLFFNEVWGLTFTCGDVPEESCSIRTYEDAIAYYGQGNYTLTGALFLAFGFLVGWTLVCFILSYILLRYRRFS